jgi:hypothetical protein
LTADVVTLKPKRKRLADGEPDGPHIHGEAFCRCGNEWMAVARVGVVHLTCPKCERRWGLFKHAIEPELAWHCDCGEALFFITKAGVMCRKCGVLQEDWWL